MLLQNQPLQVPERGRCHPMKKQLKLARIALINPRLKPMDKHFGLHHLHLQRLTHYYIVESAVLDTVQSRSPLERCQKAFNPFRYDLASTRPPLHLYRDEDTPPTPNQVRYPTIGIRRRTPKVDHTEHHHLPLQNLHQLLTECLFHPSHPFPFTIPHLLRPPPLFRPNADAATQSKPADTPDTLGNPAS